MDGWMDKGSTTLSIKSVEEIISGGSQGLKFKQNITRVYSW